jgi:hypothetical protein
MQILARELLKQHVDGIRINRKLTCIVMKFTALNGIAGGKAQHPLAIAISSNGQVKARNPLR